MVISRQVLGTRIAVVNMLWSNSAYSLLCSCSEPSTTVPCLSSCWRKTRIPKNTRIRRKKMKYVRKQIQQSTVRDLEMNCT